MKRVLIFAALVLCLSLSSCQCAEKPDVGPVEGDDEQAAVQTGPSDASSPGTVAPRV
jgi:hypothetical protein